MKVLEGVFKVALLSIGIGFLAVYFLSSHNGRYQYIKVEKGYELFDTRDGIIMEYLGGGNLELWRYDFPNKTVTITKVRSG